MNDREPVNAYELQDKLQWQEFKIVRLFKENVTLFQRVKALEEKLSTHLEVTHNGWGRTHDEPDDHLREVGG